MKILMTLEQEKDNREVEILTREAFWNIHVLGCDEHLILHKMRSHKDFIKELDFIAKVDEKIVGHIAYTHAVVMGDDHQVINVISFGPLSVLPIYQQCGIGSYLVEQSKKVARDLGYNAIIIYGDLSYYKRFGFVEAKSFNIRRADGYYAKALLALELIPGALNQISGRFIESEVFEATEEELQQFEQHFTPKEKIKTKSQLEFERLSTCVEIE